MSIGADAADQMVREGIQVTEAAIRLAALGAKNLAALLFALASNPKSRGATTARRLVKNGQPLSVIPIPKKDMRKFRWEAKRYGVLYAPIHEFGKTTNILAPTNQAAQINQVRENIGCPAGLEQDQPETPSYRRGLFGRGAGRVRVNPAAERLEEMGAENLAALVLAMASGGKQDRVELKKLAALLTNKEGVKICHLSPEQYEAVRGQADTFDIPCCGITGKDGPCTLLVRQEDEKKLDTILRNLDVTPVRRPEPTPKNSSPRAPSERESSERGIGSTECKGDRPSIKPKISEAKNRAAAMRAATQRLRPAPSAQK